MNAAVKDHLDWLQEKLAVYESKLADAESTVSKLRPVVTNLRGAIDALTSEEHGPRPSKDLFEGQSFHQNGSQQSHTATGGKGFTVGNKNPKMPNRRPEYANLTLVAAAAQVISGTPTTIHADDVTQAVFIIENKDQFALAKHSMASELHRGAKAGRWDALGQNRYRRK